MPRWIVFDQATVTALRSRLPQAAVFEAPGRAALEYALDTPKSLVTLLTRQAGAQPVIAVFRPQRSFGFAQDFGSRLGRRETASRSQPVVPAKPLQVRATGFLGLSDAPVLDEEEEVPEKRRWWQRKT